MKIKHRKSGELHEAVIELVEDEDWEVIEKSGDFKFNWKREKRRIVQKIRLEMELKNRTEKFDKFESNERTKERKEEVSQIRC